MTSADPYASRQYKTARLAVIEAAGGRCQMTPGCRNLATTCDHIIPISAGGGHSPQNLRAACRPCQDRQGGRITQAKRRAGRVGRRSRRW
jgi:5-methylcytosine-specific restriction endonuclease McrA